MTFFDKISRLCTLKGISLSAFVKDIGLSSSAPTSWKNGAIPQNRTLKKISEYFGVPMSYFTDEPKIADAEVSEYKVYNLPVFESVSAGFGSLASDTVVEYMPVPMRSKAEADESLFIRVVGDSMLPIIRSGDLVQVRKQTSVDSGELAIVMVDDEEGLVKRVEYGNNWICLISLNPQYPPQTFANEDVQRVKVFGKVKRVVRDLV